MIDLRDIETRGIILKRHHTCNQLIVTTAGEDRKDVEGPHTGSVGTIHGVFSVIYIYFMLRS